MEEVEIAISLYLEDIADSWTDKVGLVEILKKQMVLKVVTYRGMGWHFEK